MNNRKYILSGISQVTCVNLFSMLVTAVLTLIIPKYISPLNYGLWQLFVFYQGYLGFFHLGWNDGLYLRYGGCDYSSLNKKSFYSQFWGLILFEGIIGVLLLLIFNSTVQEDIPRKYIMWQLIINMIILNSRYMLLYILQATARIKEYAIILWIDRFAYISIIAILLGAQNVSYKGFILAETYSKAIAYGFAIYYCKDIIFYKVSKFYIDFKEIKENIVVGSKILFANIASILIMGICRLGIERNWGIEIFGEVSLTITLSQLFITFITNVGMILFPILKRMDKNSLIRTYSILKIGLCCFVPFVLIWFYPGSLLLKKWLPAYKNSIKFMGLLLPICFYESKMALINTTYLKAMRKEKQLMIINVWIMILSLFFTGVFSYLFKNLIMSISAITVLLALRCIWAEKTVCDRLEIKKNVVLNIENILMLIFVITNYFISGWSGFTLYAGIAIMFVTFNVKIFYKENIKK